MIADALSKRNQNQITDMQAVDQLALAVELRQRQTASADTRHAGGSGNNGLTRTEVERELRTVLSVINDAAEDALGTETQHTPRLQGQSLVTTRSAFEQKRITLPICIITSPCSSTTEIGGDHRAQRRAHKCG